jgi:L-serine dehydratase
MSLGLFDVVGPIMHGPSSNHTAGATRIGYLARQIMGDVPKAISFVFHPWFMNVFPGHRTHIALLAGCLGYREYEPEGNDAFAIAQKQGITVDYVAATDPQAPRNNMGVRGKAAGIEWDVSCDSVGGGYIVVHHLNGVPMKYDGNNWLHLYILKKGTATDDAIRLGLAKEKQSGNLKEFYAGEGEKTALFCLETKTQVPERNGEELVRLLGKENILAFRQIAPLYPFAEQSDAKPLFSTFKELADASEGRELIDVVLEFESRRSGQPKSAVLTEGLRIVDVIQNSIRRSIQGNNPLLGGLCTGSDGKYLADWAESGKSLAGRTFTIGLARAVALAELNASAGLIVAVPTAGSAGTLPGILLTVAERLGSTKEDLAKAFLIAAAIGTIVGQKATFAGSVGGCQGEVGIGAGMGAGAAVWLAGGSTEAVIHGATLTLKNVLGLTCDCPASPVEIPCIKRNGMGVAVAFMGAEMALAGVRSVVPPDDVVDGFADTQRRMPNELKGACCAGGLAGTASAKGLQQKWNDRLKTSKSSWTQ